MPPSQMWRLTMRPPPISMPANMQPRETWRSTWCQPLIMNRQSTRPKGILDSRLPNSFLIRRESRWRIRFGGQCVLHGNLAQSIIHRPAIRDGVETLQRGQEGFVSGFGHLQIPGVLNAVGQAVGSAVVETALLEIGGDDLRIKTLGGNHGPATSQHGLHGVMIHRRESPRA